MRKQASPTFGGSSLTEHQEEVGWFKVSSVAWNVTRHLQVKKEYHHTIYLHNIHLHRYITHTLGQDTALDMCTLECASQNYTITTLNCSKQMYHSLDQFCLEGIICDLKHPLNGHFSPPPNGTYSVIG